MREVIERLNSYTESSIDEVEVEYEDEEKIYDWQDIASQQKTLREVSDYIDKDFKIKLKKAPNEATKVALHKE